MSKQAKKRPKPCECECLQNIMEAEDNGHRAGVRGAHAVAASWLVDLVATVTDEPYRDIEVAIGYGPGNGNAHFLRAASILRKHFRIVPVVAKAKRRKGAK